MAPKVGSAKGSTEKGGGGILLIMVNQLLAKRLHFDGFSELFWKRAKFPPD